MGQEVRQDLAVYMHLMKALQDLLEQEWNEPTEESKVHIAIIGFYCLIILRLEDMRSSWLTLMV